MLMILPHLLLTPMSSTTNILFDVKKKDELQRLHECLCLLLS